MGLTRNTYQGYAEWLQSYRTDEMSISTLILHRLIT